MGAPEAGAPGLGAATGVVVTRGQVHAAEREALAKRAGVIVRNDVARFRLTGQGRVACLQGLVTCDVEKPGDDSYFFGALLTAKGMIVAPLWIARLPDALVVEVPAAAAAEVEAIWERSLPPRLCRFETTTQTTASVGVYGPAAQAALEDVPADSEPVAAGRVLHLECDGAPVIAARVVARGLDGFDCVAPASAAGALVERIAARGAEPISRALLEERRILAGFPRLGAEIDEKTLPQEVRLDELGAVSYTKGCYLGQETVARVHFRGHANRHLAGVTLKGASPPDALPLDLVDGGRKLGRLTSACWWEAGSCYAALAVLRPEATSGTAVQAADGSTGTIAALPWEEPGGRGIA